MMSKLCHNFGLPETCTTDGGSQYIAGDVKEFFKGLGIKHRISSVAFPHGNQKAEKSVGAAKRLIRDTVKVTGEFDEVKLIKGLLQLRNTPDRDTGLSPAELLLGRKLRDFIPGKQKCPLASFQQFEDRWNKLAKWREFALSPRHVREDERLKKSTKKLEPLVPGDHVRIQNQLGNNPKRWDKTGIVIQADPDNRQYKIMVHGSRRLSLRNRKFLKKSTPIHSNPDSPAGLPRGFSKSKLMEEQLRQDTASGRGKDTPILIEEKTNLSNDDCEARPSNSACYRPDPIYPLNETANDTLPTPNIEADPADVLVTSPNTVEYSNREEQTPQTTSATEPFTCSENEDFPFSAPNQVPLRTSSRPNKGMTSRYDDYVSSIQTPCVQAPAAPHVQIEQNLYPPYVPVFLPSPTPVLLVPMMHHFLVPYN